MQRMELMYPRLWRVSCCGVVLMSVGIGHLFQMLPGIFVLADPLHFYSSPPNLLCEHFIASNGSVCFFQIYQLKQANVFFAYFFSKKNSSSFQGKPATKQNYKVPERGSHPSEAKDRDARTTNEIHASSKNLAPRGKSPYKQGAVCLFFPDI